MNPARFDAHKHMATAVVGGAQSSLPAISQLMGNFSTASDWLEKLNLEQSQWSLVRDRNVDVAIGPNRYSQAIGVVNQMCRASDRVVAAAGGLPAEVTANWRTLGIGTVDVEFGFSCMGYEISGGYGARIAQLDDDPGSDTIIFVGDGSYLLLNGDLYSAVITDKKLIVILLNNGGFAVIDKLQTGKGNASYNNLFVDTPTATRMAPVDFVSHARSLGADAEKVADAQAFQSAFARAQQSANSYVIVMDVDPYDGWTTEGHAWWEVGTPSVSKRRSVRDGHAETESGRQQQRRGRVVVDLGLDSSKPFLVIGRAGMDLYPTPINTKTADATEFVSALGGSSANIAVALCRLGQRASLVTCISDDAIGSLLRTN